MTEVWLVRHGQASLGAGNYDQLSPLGTQQGQWLGEYLQARAGDRPVDLLTGQMARQQQTADAIGQSLTFRTVRRARAFDEFDFETVVMSWLGANPGYPLSEKPEPGELKDLLHQSMLAWAGDQLTLPAGAESWQAFHQRVCDGWQSLAPAADAVTLVVSSAGAIASTLRHLLGLDDRATLALNLQIGNASLTRVTHTRQGYALSAFNDVSHLEQPARAHALTFA